MYLYQKVGIKEEFHNTGVNMKLDLTNFAYELSSGMYKDCTLGDALVKEFAIQSIVQIKRMDASIISAQRENDMNEFLKNQQ